MTSAFADESGVSSEELLRRCRECDESALRELLHRYERPVYSLLYRMLGSREDADEALADVFYKVWRAAGSFRGRSKFTTWLYRIAANTAHDVLRSRRSRPEVTVEDVILADTDLVGTAEADPEQAVIEGEQLDTIGMAMQRLSEEDRFLVTLYHLEECSLQEISEVTGGSPTNLKVKLFRARQKLRAHLGELDRETTDEMRAGTTEPFGLQPGAS